MTEMSEALSLLQAVLHGLGVLVALLWIAMAFAVFAMARRMRLLAEQQKLTNDLLRVMLGERRAEAPPRGRTRPGEAPPEPPSLGLVVSREDRPG
jgi:hypothetical protein